MDARDDWFPLPAMHLAPGQRMSMRLPELVAGAVGSITVATRDNMDGDVIVELQVKVYEASS